VRDYEELKNEEEERSWREAITALSMGPYVWHETGGGTDYRAAFFS